MATDRSKIGGSDMAALLGVDGYGKTALDVYLEKVGEAEPREETEAMFWGKELEDRIARRWADLEGVKIRRRQPIQHPDHDWLRISPDRDVVGRPKEGLEVKLSSAGDWGEEGTDEIPVWMLPQVHTYIAATGAERWHVAALLWSFGPPRLQRYIVERDPEMVDIILETGSRFWQEHVVPRVPPDPETSEQASVRWRKAQIGKSVVVPIETLDVVAELEGVKRGQKVLRDERDRLELALKTLLQDAEAGVDQAGNPLVTWKEQGQRRFDESQFRVEHPDLYQQFQTERRFRVLRIPAASRKAAKEFAG